MNYGFWLPAAVIAVVTFAVPLLFHLARRLGRSKAGTRRQGDVYESGVSAPYKDSFERFNIKYYLVAIIFVIFDVEILFMFPWAVTLRDLGLFGLIEMFVFMGLLLAGLIYIYRKKALRWN
jgi:NADH-quinone oxidoreductase subunit A